MNPIATPKILIVDDDENFVYFVKLNLEASGKYIVEGVSDPCKAFQSAKAFRPDLVLLDLVMPAMDGAEVAQQLKDDRETKNTPLIFLTALINWEEEEAVINNRHKFISKPVSVENLTKQIDATLEKWKN